MRHPVLRDAEVRKAISEALDRDTLIRDGLSGRGSAADGPIWPQHFAYSPPAEPFTYDPESARRRLDAAGYRIHRATGSAGPMRFSLTCLVFAPDTRFERLAMLVQKQLADVGIDLKLLPLRQEELVLRLRNGDFDTFLFEFAGRSLSWVYDFWRSHEGMRNNSGYRSADAVLDRLRAARSDDEIRARVAELERVMHDDPPAAFIAWQETSRAVSKKFDVGSETNHDILSNVWQWRPADAARQAVR